MLNRIPAQPTGDANPTFPNPWGLCTSILLYGKNKLLHRNPPQPLGMQPHTSLSLGAWALQGEVTVQGTKWLHFPQLGSRKVRRKYGERGGATEKATNHIPLTQHSRNMWINLDCFPFASEYSHATSQIPIKDFQY